MTPSRELIPVYRGEPRIPLPTIDAYVKPASLGFRPALRADI